MTDKRLGHLQHKLGYIAPSQRKLKMLCWENAKKNNFNQLFERGTRGHVRYHESSLPGQYSSTITLLLLDFNNSTL